MCDQSVIKEAAGGLEMTECNAQRLEIHGLGRRIVAEDCKGGMINRARWPETKRLPERFETC